MQQVKEEARDGYRQLTIEENGTMLHAIARYDGQPREVFLWIGPTAQRYAGASYFRVGPDAWNQLVGMVAQGGHSMGTLTEEEREVTARVTIEGCEHGDDHTLVFEADDQFPGAEYVLLKVVNPRDFDETMIFSITREQWLQLDAAMKSSFPAPGGERPKDAGRPEVDPSHLIDALAARCAFAEMKLQVAEQAAHAWREVADAYKGLHSTYEMESLKAMHAAAARQSGLRNEFEPE